MDIAPMLKNLIRPAYHRLQRLRQPVVFGDVNSSRPIGSKMGFQRGKPIDRFYIERFIESHANLIRGKVLEVAEPLYAGKHQREGETHILHVSDPSADLHADLTDINALPDSKYDCFIMTQTLNVIFDVRAALQGALRLLKPGGVLLATVCGIAQVSRDDYEQWGDFWRFTDLAIKRLLEEADFTDIDLTVYGNAMAAQILLQGLALQDVPDSRMLLENDPDYQVIIGMRAIKPA